MPSLSYNCSSSCMYEGLYQLVPVYFSIYLLNQANRPQAGVPGFYKLILSNKCVCMCVSVSVCSPPRLLITSGIIWTPNDWLNKFYSFCMAAIVGIISRHGLRNESRHRNQPNKSKLALYKPLLHFYSHVKQLYTSNKTALQL